jgi:hypothetical protein
MQALQMLISSPWFWASLALSGLGGVIVAWGLRVEKLAERKLPPSDFKTDIFEDVAEEAKRGIERGWKILMTGIIFEVVAAFAISIISGLEVANLTLEARQAGKDAGDAKVVAARIGTTNAQISLQVEQLRRENEEFRIKLMPKWLKFDPWKFSDALIGKPQFEVEVLYPSNDDEPSYKLAMELKTGFSFAHWEKVIVRPISESDIMGSDSPKYPASLRNRPIRERAEGRMDVYSLSTNSKMSVNALIPTNGITIMIDALGAATSTGLHTNVPFSGWTFSENPTVPDNTLRIIVP